MISTKTSPLPLRIAQGWRDRVNEISEPGEGKAEFIRMVLKPFLTGAYTFDRCPQSGELINIRESPEGEVFDLEPAPRRGRPEKK